MLKKSIIIFVIGISIFIQSPSSAHAAQLEVVFKSGLWGSLIGFSTGLAIWALREEDTDSLSFFLVRGTALGLLGGVGYGLYEVNSGVAESQTRQTKGLVHFASQKNLLEISLTPGSLSLSHGRGELQWNAKVFTASF